MWMSHVSTIIHMSRGFCLGFVRHIGMFESPYTRKLGMNPSLRQVVFPSCTK